MGDKNCEGIMRIETLLKRSAVGLVMIIAMLLLAPCLQASEAIQVFSGKSLDVFNIGDSLDTFKAKIPKSSFSSYNLKYSKLENWNYKLEDKTNINKVLSFRIENNIIRAISFHYGKSACTNSIYMPFNVNGKPVVMNMTTESKMKRLFPQNEPYVYQVIGLLNLKEGIDFNFYPNECNSKDGQDVVKTIVIFEKGNSFLFDNESEY